MILDEIVKEKLVEVEALKEKIKLPFDIDKRYPAEDPRFQESDNQARHEPYSRNESRIAFRGNDIR